MDILYQCNDKYAPYCGVSVTSLFENNKDAGNIRVFILDDGIADENKQKFFLLEEQYGRTVEFVETAPLIEKIKALGIPPYRGSYTTNFKMFVSEFIPDSVSKVLYIDSDTVVTGSLSDVFALDLGDKPIGMVMDSLVGSYRRLVGLKGDDRYFNAGVLFFNMAMWKKQRRTERIVEHTKTVRAHYPAPDQDLINITVRGNIYCLPARYNLQPALVMFRLGTYFKVFRNPMYYSSEEIEAAKADPRIVHFFRVLGEFPWHKDNLHPFNALFDQYLAISPWKDYIKQPSGVSVIFAIEKILYKILPDFLFAVIFNLSHEYFMKKSNALSLKRQNNKLM